MISPGDSCTTEHTVSDEIVRAYANVTADANPIHVDDEYAKRTQFGQRIAPGILAGSFISGTIGSRLPGNGTIYLSQTLSFKAPTYIGDRVLVTVTCIEIVPNKPIAKLQTQVHRADGTLLVDGEAVVKLPPEK